MLRKYKTEWLQHWDLVGKMYLPMTGVTKYLSNEIGNAIIIRINAIMSLE